MKIDVVISNDGKTTRLSFPIDDEDLIDKVASISSAEECYRTNFTLEKVISPEDMIGILPNTINVDELNFIANRLDGFQQSEILQFYAAAETGKFHSLKDLINLTFNLDKFTLIRDASNLERVGKEYVFNTKGGMASEDIPKTDFATIGKNILSKGNTNVTSYGIVIVEEKPLEETYNGKTFPLYITAYSYAKCILEYNEGTELICLPCSDATIHKALLRLGAASTKDCSIEISGTAATDKAIECMSIYDDNSENLNVVNHILQRIKVGDYGSYHQFDFKKFIAICEYAECYGEDTLDRILDRNSSIGFFPYVEDKTELARQWIDYKDICLDEDLEDYIDFERYGEDIAEDNNGIFVEGHGFLFSEYEDLHEMLNIEYNNGMCMQCWC